MLMKMTISTKMIINKNAIVVRIRVGPMLADASVGPSLSWPIFSSTTEESST